jgi:hypothetical protein
MAPARTKRSRFASSARAHRPPSLKTASENAELGRLFLVEVENAVAVMARSHALAA